MVLEASTHCVWTLLIGRLSGVLGIWIISSTPHHPGLESNNLLAVDVLKCDNRILSMCIVAVGLAFFNSLPANGDESFI